MRDEFQNPNRQRMPALSLGHNPGNDSFAARRNTFAAAFRDPRRRRFQKLKVRAGRGGEQGHNQYQDRVAKDSQLRISLESSY
jgi:hypothetical protein